MGGPTQAIRVSHLSLWLAGLACGCGSVTVYLQGPSPQAALPGPEVRLLLRERTEDGAFSAGRVVLALPGSPSDSAESVEVTGVVGRVVRGSAPRWGFRLQIDGSERIALLDVATFREMPDLGLSVGAAASIEVRPEKTGVALAVRDKRGEAFRLWVGRTAPRPSAWGDMVVQTTDREAYHEVRSGEDLCRRTDVHRAARITFGPSEATLDPGEEAVLCGGGDTCRLVVLSQASETAEQECGDRLPPRLSAFWVRVPQNTVVPP